MTGIDPKDLVFALDIGTRTVVGIVGVNEDKFRIIATEVAAHKGRAMFDGQIHDIDQVTKIVLEVKNKLEKKLGATLNQVAIAAAGRTLKTCQSRVDWELEPGAEIGRELISSLEIEAIQKAQNIIEETIPEEDRKDFYCVGYSVVNYFLNGYVISNLSGHKGKTAGVEVLATFLPHVVVDSLYTVMNRAGLGVSSFTLEPIAAINVTIPAELRLLNLALVDIGAGTSDIAITRDGSIVAYAMVPCAGDEITERILHKYLVDFKTAEMIKIAYSEGKEKLTFVDILNNKRTIELAEAGEVIAPVLEFIAKDISDKIMEFNGKAPNAVFLVGGGSRTTSLSSMIAEKLNLTPDRVVVRGRDIIRNVQFNDRKLTGPESITPYGIAVTAKTHDGGDFLNVTVNGRGIRLFNSKRLTVSDALILMGFEPEQLIGRSGKSLTFELNGVKKTLRGEGGTPAEIFVNQKPASLETVIINEDIITVVPAKNGKDRTVTAGELLKSEGSAAQKVTLDGREVDVGTEILVNGRIPSMGEPISEGDKVEIIGIKTLGDLLKATCTEYDPSELKVNGKKAGPDYVLNNYDIVETKSGKNAPKSAPAAGRIYPADVKEQVQVPAVVSNTSSYASSPDTGFAVTINGQKVFLNRDKSEHIFVDVFNYINFDLSKPQGSVVLKLNGRQAAFTDVIKPGDQIEVYWQK